MKRRILSLICAAAVAATWTAAVPSYTNEVSANSDVGDTIAFPGAEGGGMYSLGARGALEDGESIEVYHVTNLNDSGEGSFRDAVSQGNRIVVFDVSGYIDLDSNVNISKGNMTILGQTAPGDGITFRSNNIKVSGKNVIVRYLKFRVGSKDADGNDTRAQDGLEITDNAENIILDHCSVSWGTDENLSAYAVKNVTIQWSIIAEALNQSVHDKGEHSYAAIWGGVNLSVHHNLIATHKSRNPKIGTSETVSMTSGYTDDKTLVDIRNNIIYNWGDKAGYGAENGAEVNIINNYYKPGPATPDAKRARIFELSPGNKYQTNWSGKIYANGNVVDDNSTTATAVANAAAVNQENWQIDLGTGVYLSDSSLTYEKLTSPNETYITDYPITTTSAEQAYEDVLENAGATLPKRDAVDTRILENVANRTAPSGSSGSTGLLDDPLDGIPEGEEASYDDRGYPIIESESRAADYDTDGDGIPDEWEDAMGLDSSNPLDSVNITAEGYTWLETFVEESLTKSDDAGLAVEANSDKVLTVAADTVTLTASMASVAAQNIEKAEFYLGSTLAATASDAETSGGNVSYGDGTVSFTVLESYPENLTVIAAGYDADGKLADVRLASCARADVGTAQSVEVGEVSGDTVKAFLWSGMDEIKPLDTADGNSAVYTASVSGLPTGENYLVAKVFKLDGSYTLSPTKKIYIGGGALPEIWSGTGGYDGEYYTVYGGAEDAQTVQRTESGDFTIVCEVSEISNTADGALSGIFVEAGGTRHFIGKGYEDYAIVVKCGDQTVSDADGIKYLRIEREGSSLTFSAAENLLEWQTVAQESISDGEVTVGAAVESDTATMTKFGRLDMIYEKTSPQISITNVDNNQTLDFDTTLEVNVTPDNASVQEIDVMLNDDVVSTLTGDFSGTVSIPLTFDSVASGTLRVVCVDANLCTAEDSRAVVVSADPTPWSIADIGGTGEELPSYVEVAESETYKNETYKINAIDGAIGGTSDKFGYLYQQMSGDRIIYYRSRMQSGKQFGVVLKSDLDANGVTYFFGGDATGESLAYSLRARTTAGGEMSTVADVTDVTGSSSNLYFAVEKKGDTLNVYQTYASSTVYTEKVLLASCDVSALGDTYYLGFGAVNDSSNPPDAGWFELDGIPTDDLVSYEWDFDNGIDWYWQLQEKNVLEPEWTTEELSGNSSGKMMIAPDDSYTGERFIFREYLVPDDTALVLTESFDIMLTGEEPAINAYFRTDASNAFGVSFDDEGNICDGAGNIIGSYENFKWYTVSISSDMGADSGACSVSVTDSDGNTVASVSECDAVTMRDQNNIVKKTSVTNAVYFEPVYGAEGTYYIDNVSVIGTKSSVQKVITGEYFWKFSDGAFADVSTTVSGTSYDGLTVMGALTIDGSNKTIDGASFTKRLKLGGSGSTTSKCVKFDIPEGTTTITVYGAPAGTSGTRSVIINDGTEHSTVLSSETSATLEYSGAARTIYVYGDSAINLYGVKYQTYEYVTE